MSLSDTSTTPPAVVPGSSPASSPQSRLAVWRRADPALTTIGVIFLVLLWFQPAQAEASAGFVLKAVLSVAPLFLFSIVLLSATTAAGADNLIARAFVGRVGPMVVLAALMGALSPFCSCGVIPLIAALLSMGVPLPAVMAFWLASPLMDPAQFVLTASVLGWPFAVAKTVAAIAIGLIGGFGTLALIKGGLLQTPLRASAGNGGCGGAKVRNPKEVVWRFWREPARLANGLRAARTNGLFLGKMLLLAFVLESLMVAWMPAGLVWPRGAVAWRRRHWRHPVRHADRHPGLSERHGGAAADARTDEPGHGAGRGAGLPDRRWRDLDPGRHRGLVDRPAGGVRGLCRLCRHRLSRRGPRLAGVRGFVLKEPFS